MISPTLAPVPVITAFVATVLACTKRRTSPGTASPARTICSSPEQIASLKSRVEDRTLRIDRRPAESTATMSVNVPPTSTPMLCMAPFAEPRRN